MVDPNNADPKTAGPERVLILIYAVFVLAAGGRSAVQLATEASRAPLAYSLSAVAAITYCLGAASLAGAPRHRRSRRWVFAIELIGVLIVGSWTYLDPAAFPEPTVWSHFGSGYGYLPAVLPILALLWTAVPARATADARSIRRRTASPVQIDRL